VNARSIQCALFCVLCSAGSGQWLETNVDIPGTPAPCALVFDSVANAVYVGGSGRHLAVLDGNSGAWREFVSVGASPQALCYDAGRGRVCSANREDSTVSVIDGATHELVATIPVGRGPVALCHNPANNRLYCANSDGRSVSVLDADSNVVVATIEVPGEPQAMCLAGPNRLFCATFWGRVVVIDCSTDSLVDTVWVGDYPRALCYNQAGNRVYCANSYDDDVTVIDAATDSVLATIAVGREPWALCYVPGVNRVFCADYSSSTVTVIDGATNAVIDTIDVEEGPYALLYYPGSNRVYCANSSDASISVIDPVTDSVVATMPAGEGSAALCVSPTSGRLFSANMSDEDVTVFDCATNQVVRTTTLGSWPVAVCYDSLDDKVYCANERGWVTVVRGDTSLPGATIQTGTAPQDVCWNPVNDRVYCANDGTNTVTVISGATDSVLATVNVGAWPRTLIHVSSLNRVYCANFSGNSVSVIDGATNGVVATIAVGQGPIALCYNPNGNKVYTANLGSNTVSVLNAAMNNVIATIPVGSYPIDLCYDPVFDRIYCANANGYSVTVIDGTTNQAVTTTPVGSTPLSLCYCPTNRSVYCACFGWGGVFVIDCSTSAVVDTIIARTCPSDLCYVPASNRMYAAHQDGYVVTGIHCAVNEPFWTVDVPEGPTDLCWNPRRNRLYAADYWGHAVSVIRDASVDVGPREVRVPAGEYELDDIVSPVVVCLNYGNAPADFEVWVSLFDDTGRVRYTDKVDVNGLAPGQDTLLTGFEPYTLTSAGWWAARCSTCMVGDSIPHDDVIARQFLVNHPDVAAVAIVAPLGPVDTGTVIAPTARWQNYHGHAVDFIAFMMLAKPSGECVYLDSLHVAGLVWQCETTLVFPPFRLDQTQGDWTARCSTSTPGDINPWNDVCSRRFRVVGGVHLPQYGWAEMTPMPAAPSNKPVKDGGWLQYIEGIELLYAAKGGKTSDFYSYDPLADTWRQRALIPAGREGKLPGRGAAATTDGERYIYATKGNNTLGFYRYDAVRDTWRQLSDVPVGTSNKKVRGGTDVAWVEGDERDYVYLLKGYKNEFYRFDISRNAWETMPSAPASGTNQKWDKGSWLVYDDDCTIYAHRAKFNELWQYDVETDSWVGRLNGMPIIGRSGKKKKSKDGGCAVMPDDIYALKGGNTQEFWVYFVDDDFWLELDTIPTNGSAGRKRVKAGADIATDYGGVLFATKGGRTSEFWRYVPDFLWRGTSPRPGREGVLAVATEATQWSLFPTIAPGVLVLPFSPVSVHCVLISTDGRVVMSLRPGPNDVRRLSPGVYFVREEGEKGVTEPVRKVVITR